MKKLLITLSLIMICLFSQAQFYFNGYIDQPISCTGNNDASIQLITWNYDSLHNKIPVPNIQYINYGWSFPFEHEINTTGFFSHLRPGKYRSCAFLEESNMRCYEFFIIDEAVPLDIKFNIETPLTCNTNGSLSIDITGGTANLQPYLTWWTNAAGDTLNNVLLNNFASYMSELGEGTYNVAIEDDNGCFYNESYVLWKQGDFNHDSNIDLFDIAILENDVNNFIFGENIETDLNKDGNVDLFDISLMTKIFTDCN